MKRLQLFELEDQQWFPAFLKDNIRDYLKFMVSYFKLYGPAEKELTNVIQKSGCRSVIDLCSGSGGNTLEMQQRIKSTIKDELKIFITDLYPNLKAKQFFKTHFPSPDVVYIEESVDATNVPEKYKGVRTVFTAFHHFSPDLAKKILQDAANNNSPITVFEFNNRRFSDLFLIFFFTPLFVLLVTPFIRPFRWDRLLFTYIIPILPVAIWWDAIVSTLRAYTPKELLNLTKGLQQRMQFEWKTGYLDKGLVKITYLTGVPLMTTIKGRS